LEALRFDAHKPYFSREFLEIYNGMCCSFSASDGQLKSRRRNVVIGNFLEEYDQIIGVSQKFFLLAVLMLKNCGDTCLAERAKAYKMNETPLAFYDPIVAAEYEEEIKPGDHRYHDLPFEIVPLEDKEGPYWTVVIFPEFILKGEKFEDCLKAGIANVAAVCELLFHLNQAIQLEEDNHRIVISLALDFPHILRPLALAAKDRCRNFLNSSNTPTPWDALCTTLPEN
jgi:hypothetical protein